MKKIIFLLAAVCGFFYFQNAQATCSNPASYSDGNVLTAASLNTNFGAAPTCVNDVLNGDIFTGNMSWHTGVDALFYSDTGSTLTASIAGDSGNIFLDGTLAIGTGGVVLSDDGDGALTITGAGNGSDEDLTLNLDDTANTAVISSSTGVTDLNLHGIGLNVYSDSGTTLKASINKTTGTIIGGLTQAGQVTNCGISVSGSTFTIAGYDGTALSATNPCVVAVRSSTAGRVALAYFTANVTFTFGSTSDTDGNLFGITDANWSNAMPFFIGVIYNGTTPYFTISRVPSYVSGAANTDLCQKGDTDCDAQDDVMVLTTGLTLSNFVNLPITQVGWSQMTYATSGSAWTATTSIQTGFNFEFEKSFFTFPQGQMGADSGSHLNGGGSTLPVFTTNLCQYQIDRSGIVYFQVDLVSDGGTDGSGAGAVAIAMPYKFKAQDSAGNIMFAGSLRLQSSVIGKAIGIFQAASTYTFAYLERPTLSGSNLQNSTIEAICSDFGNGNRSIIGSMFYKSF